MIYISYIYESYINVRHFKKGIQSWYIYIYIYIYIAFVQDAKANTVYVICLPGVFYRA